MSNGARGAQRGSGVWACGWLVSVVLLLAMCALAPTPVGAVGTTYYVGSTGDSTTTTNCTSATNTTCTLRGAISVATSGSDTIRFTAALNGQTIILTSNTTLALATSVTIDGTGSGATIDGHCTLMLGVCTVTGGGTIVFVVNGGVTVTLNALTIQHGNAGGLGGGGGAYNYGTLNLTNSVFSGNAARDGGAVFGDDGSTLNVTNSVLSGNNASSGGAIWSATATVNVTNSTLSGNTAVNNGGAIDNENGGTVNVTNSTLSGNSAPRGEGGGIYNPGYMLTVTNSTLSGNAANDGGGIANFGTTTITNSTIANNTAGATGGGGVYINGGTLNLANTILAGNSASGNGDDLYRYPPRATVNAKYTVFQSVVTVGPMGTVNGTATNNFIGTDPQLSALADNGGPTRTLAIPTNSIAYHTGDPTTCTTAVSSGGAGGTDQRGTVRDAMHCSIGAFEPGLVSTTTALTAAPMSGAYGTSVTLTATVRGVRGGTPPDGTNAVTFTNGMTTLGTANLTGGTAIFTTTTLPPGNSVTATYTAGGAGNPYASSPASNAVRVTITPVSCTVGVVSSSAMGTSVFGQNVTFTATVTGVNGTAPTSTVQFAYTPSGGMSTPIGMPVTLDMMGKATVSTSTLPAGTDTITATYSGDGNYLTSSGAVTQSVSKASTTTSVTAMPTTSTFGQSVTLTATVAVLPPGAGTPTGTVTFTAGGTALGMGMVNGSGVATLATAALPVGADQTITATYSGDPNFTLSSGTTTVTVIPVTITLTAPTGSGSGNSGTGSAPSIRAGSSITLRANPSTGVTYTSSNANVASVDPSTGVVTGISGGTAVIMASGPNGSGGSITVAVTGGTGTGLMAPAPAPMVHTGAATAAPGVTVAPQPMSHANGSGTGGGVGPQAVGGPTATPEVQPARH